MTIFLGWLLLLIPFLLVFCFTDRGRGFLYILAADIAWHLFIALTTQGLHIFSYPLIFGLNLAVAFAVIFILAKKNKSISFKFKVNWFLVLVFGIIIFELGSVHYFYSGEASTITEKKTVERINYPYPYFSDEWIGVAFTNYSIDNHALPTVNPLTGSAVHKNFSNIFIVFFSGLAEIFLLLNLSPLTGYALITLLSGVLICFLVYLLLKRNDVGPLPAALATLCLPLIVNGQNLPGLWYLLPITGGLIPFLIMLASASTRDYLLTGLSGFLALLLYPPLVVFIIPLLVFNLLSAKNLRNIAKLKLILLGFLIIASVAFLIIILQKSSFFGWFGLINSYLLYPALERGIPAFAIWTVVPWLILPFTFFGLIILWQKKLFFLLIPLLTGLFFWIIYSRSLYFFLIGYDRLVLVTSLLVVAMAAFGFDWLEKKINKKFSLFRQPDVNLEIKIFLLLIFLFFSWSYTQRANWSKLILRIPTALGEEINQPLAPATMFLTEDDSNFFKDLSNRKRFLAPAWKGLVIGAAYSLYPLDTKSAIVTNRIISYDFFMQQDCAEKEKIARQYRLKYIYALPFSCDRFFELGVSNEGLHFYQFVR